jgi:hypothetical protein
MFGKNINFCFQNPYFFRDFCDFFVIFFEKNFLTENQQQNKGVLILSKLYEYKYKVCIMGYKQHSNYCGFKTDSFSFRKKFKNSKIWTHFCFFHKKSSLSILL